MIANVLNTCEVVDRVMSAAAEFDLGKLTLRDMVHARTDLEYINPKPLSVGGGIPLHIINKVLIW